MSSDQIVLSVKASFAIQRNPSTNALELLFDSMAQPLTPGARASVTSGRQLLYRIGSVYVDMEIRRTSNSEGASLVGQMLDSASPGHPLAGIGVAVHERGRRIASTLSNDNGEFHLEFDAKDDLKLLLEVDRRYPVHLPIRDIGRQFGTVSSGKRRRTGARVGRHREGKGRAQD